MHTNGIFKSFMVSSLVCLSTAAQQFDCKMTEAIQRNGQYLVNDCVLEGDPKILDEGGTYAGSSLRLCSHCACRKFSRFQSQREDAN